MKIYDLKTMQECEITQSTVVALGTFDGAHLGHNHVFQEAFLKAKALEAKFAIYTFDTRATKKVKNILTLEEKLKFIRKSLADYVIIEDFDAIKEMEGQDFVKAVLIDKLKAVCGCCGFNYRFGKNGSCDASDLATFFEKNGGSVVICNEITLNGQTISSTLIRSLIENGEIERILDFSPPYSVYARVQEGKKLGRTIGIPTINQQIPQDKISPKRGVYITECEIGEDVYPSITNVGTRPTVEENGCENIETHIIDFDGTLYHSYIRVNFYKRLRDEIKFDSLKELKNQIEKDILQAKKYFK